MQKIETEGTLEPFMVKTDQTQTNTSIMSIGKFTSLDTSISNEHNQAFKEIEAKKRQERNQGQIKIADGSDEEDSDSLEDGAL